MKKDDNLISKKKVLEKEIVDELKLVLDGLLIISKLAQKKAKDIKN